MKFFKTAVFIAFSWILLARPALAQTISRVDVSADSAFLVAGQKTTAIARAKDADGVVIPNVQLTWTSATPNIATVDANGLVTALFPGSVQIRARTSNNIQGTFTFTVTPARVEVSGSSSIRLNQSMAVVARGFDINGSALSGLTFTWASDNTSVATVTAGGMVQATGLGQAVITATQSNYVGTLTLTVERPKDFTIQTVLTSDAVQGAESRIQTITSMSNMNSRADMAFVANLSGTTTAVIRDIQGQLSALARTGDSAPFGGVFASFNQPVINNRGDVVFVANVTNGTGPLLMFARGSDVYALLASGDTVEAGGTIGGITLASDGLDDNGFAVATLTLSNPTHSGVFRISPETRLEPLIRTYDETSLGTPTAFTGVSVSRSGRVGVIVTAGGRRGVFLVTPTSINAVAVDGAALPGGGTLSTFQALRTLDSSVLLLATPTPGSLSLYRHTSTGIQELVHGGVSGARSIVISSLQGATEDTVTMIASVSDLGGFGIFRWNGTLSAAFIRNAAVSSGETLTRLDAAWITPAGELSVLAVGDRHLAGIYRISSQTRALRWGTGSTVPLAANYYITTNSNLRPAGTTTYFLAGFPAGLFKKSGNTVTPVAIPGMTTPRGDVFTNVTIAGSNGSGDVVFVGTTMDLTRTTTTTNLYRYASNGLTEWVPFNQSVTITGVGASTIGTGGLSSVGINSAGQAAFAGTVSNRTSLILAGADLRILLQSGAVSPSGGTFTAFSNIQLTPAGSVVFTGTVTGGPGGIFMFSNGRVTALALSTEYTNLAAAVTGGESVYFSALRGGVPALWVAVNGNVQQLLTAGAAMPTNTAVTSFGAYSAQEDGTLAFVAFASFTGVFTRQTDGTLSTVVLTTEPTPASGRFSTFTTLAMANSAVLVNSIVTVDRTGLFMAWPEGRPQQTPVSSTDFSLANRAVVSLRTDGQASGVTTGYAVVRTVAGSTAPSGLAIFSSRQGGVLVSEATVPASPLVQSGRIYAEVNGTSNTGIAIANPNSQSATVSFYFTDAQGQNSVGGTASIPAGGQIAKFLNEDPFNSGAFRVGSFTFSSSVPISVVALRGYTNERSEFLITTLPVGPASQTAADAIIFPHFADGLGWTTQVILVNPSDAVISGTGQFFSTQGGSTFSYSIAARSSYVLKTDGAGASVRTGWVRVVPNAGTVTPSGLLIFSYKNNGITVTEASVPGSPLAAASRVYLEASGNVSTGQIGAIQSGIAIANPNAANVTVSFDVTNLSGASIGFFGSATIPAQGQIALFANQISGLETLLVAQGVLRISSTAPVAVMGLRGRNNERGDFLITTVQPVNESTAASTTDVYLPHFVDSGGYSTQFILYSGGVNQSSSGTIRFFSQSGQPASLTMR